MQKYEGICKNGNTKKCRQNIKKINSIPISGNKKNMQYLEI